MDEKAITCIHFNGISHKHCKANVPYKKFRKDSGWFLPCFEYIGINTCSSRKFPTKKDIEEIKEKLSKNKNSDRPSIDMLISINKHIDETKRISDRIVCPICNTFSLRYKKQGNGHIHYACSICEIYVMQ